MSIQEDTDERSFFSFMADLKVTLGDVRSTVEKLAKAVNDERMDRSKKESERWIRIHGTAILDSNGFAVITFDNKGPDQGYYWYVRKLVVGGLTPTTTAAGRLDVFVSAANLDNTPTLAEIGLADWQDQATALPLVGPYGDGELVLRAPEKLFVVVSGGTATQQIVCTGTIKQLQESTAMPVASV